MSTVIIVVLVIVCLLMGAFIGEAFSSVIKLLGNMFRHMKDTK